MLRLARYWLVVLLVLACSAAAFARDTFHDLDAAKARAEGHGHENLLAVPLFMAGAPHAAIASDLGVFTSNRRTNAAGKSDEEACQIAFLSALISLQSRAQALGADAVVDIRSITKHNDLESATQYRCVAGNIVANVALQGRMVKLKK
ncbi:MAG TPA: excinuclease ABC subunit A [Myxococcota bacterium]|jgi:uncharacterized protein YbjQ (UPF0145 family)